MIVTKKAIPRRTVLRGLGASVALPLLDGMVPAMTPLRLTAAQPVARLGIVFVPNGMMMQKWAPATEGPLEITPILEPLKPYRDQMLMVSGLANRTADALPGEGGGDHSRSQASFLTGVHAKKTEGADFEAGMSMDQIAAKELGKETQLASLELALESTEMMGTCDIGYSCVYSGTIAWRTPTTPLPMETDPRAAFERLFGASDTTDSRARLARIATERSILDSVQRDVSQLRRRLGARDGAKLGEYLEAVRDIERRIQKAEEQSSRELPAVGQPEGIPSTFEEHGKLMFDLLALAYQSDLTRVATFMIAREISMRTYPEIGVPEPHHPVSHHGDNPAQLEKLAKINVFHMSLFAHFVEKMRTTEDGDGSLLDHSTFIYGAGISNSNLHLHYDLPMLLVGGGAGTLKGGRHIRVPKDTPVTNLYLTVLDKVGVHAERLGDSTGQVALLSAV
jgi:hypothetical protein